MFRVLLVCLGLVALCAGAGEVAVSKASVLRSASVFGPGTRALEGLITCGSAGNIRDVSFEGCQRTPCETHVGNQYRIEVQFVPSRNYEALSLVIELFTNAGVEPILDGEIPNSAVEAGTQYTFGFTITTTGAFTGAANILFRVYGAEQLDEICFIAGVNVIPA